MYKYRAEITKGEEIRYISHLDYAALVERAFCRIKDFRRVATRHIRRASTSA